MLTHLGIKNFTLVDNLDLDLRSGMTVITGETGAGKSIVLDALGLCLGDRASTMQVRKGTARAEISASFDWCRHPRARAYLQQYDLIDDDHCLLRRLVRADGGSRAWINGHQVTLAQVRALAEQFIDIHSQHEHQSLLRPDVQRQLLDDFAGHSAQVADMARLFDDWQAASQHLASLTQNADQRAERLEYLRFQVDELQALDLAAGEFDRLEEEQRLLASSAELLATSAQMESMLCGDGDGGNLQSALRSVLALFDGLPHKTADLEEVEALLREADIQVEEAAAQLRRATPPGQDPQRLAIVEERISSAFELSRKHRVPPDELPQVHEKLSLELQQLQEDSPDIDSLRAAVAKMQSRYNQAAAAISKSRHEAAPKLATAICDQMRELALKGAAICVELAPCDAARHGTERATFLVRTNPGQDFAAISKVASGGELSRISLAVAVVTAHSSRASTMVFDEVDSGIGGAVADVVGQRLQQLARHSQVICVTHLPQVACRGDHHLQAQKSVTDNNTDARLMPLDEHARVQELARMLGGEPVTEQALRHAGEMLERARRAA